MKNQAQWRGEAWTISFEEYKQLWGEHWHNRGREKGCYCMTRRDPTEPWTPANAQVITREQHARTQSARSHAGFRSEAQTRWRIKNGLPLDRKRKPGRRPKDE